MTATTANQITFTRNDDGGYNVIRAGVILGAVSKFGRGWGWHVAGDREMGPLMASTRTEAAQRVVDCVDTRAMFAAHEQARQDRIAARATAAQAGGYEPLDVAEAAPGQMVRLWKGDVLGDPVLVLRHEVFDHGGAIMIHIPADRVRFQHGAPLPTDIAMLSASARTVMARTERTPQAEATWTRWEALTEDSPNAYALRAIPDGWTPDTWDAVAVGDVIRVPTRVRYDRVYEWSRARTVGYIHRPGDWVFIAYTYTDFDGETRHGSETLQAPLVARGVLRPPAPKRPAG
ncbi:hypothetical protein AB0395_34775 [Streptosporangium sp. NPDC051023]|uniref:hypothetical protein n=1 Tax=Streptosporangium sp. NPDC051023 TaxID=3155410 RepID=UPI00344DD921